MHTIGDVVHAQFAKYVQRLHDYAPLAARDEPDAVHQMRVTSRKLRSLMRVFADRFTPGSLTALRSELDWLGGVLGAARDLEVITAHLDADTHLTQIHDHLAAEHDKAMLEVQDALASTRFGDVLAALVEFIDAPPWSEAARQPIRPATLAILSAERARVAKRVRRERLAPEAGRDEILHDVRKSARRARYAAEALPGLRAKFVAAQMERAQDTLGSHQDAVVCLELLENWTDPSLADVRDRLQQRAASDRLHYARHARKLMRFGR